MYEQTSMIGPQTAARYYEINEETARNAHYCVHMSDYKPGSATAEYRCAVDKAAALVEAKKARVSPFYHDKLDALLDRYAHRLAQWMNDYNRNQASYPSQFISGAGGYNMRKHEKQMSREGTLWNKYDEIKAILNKIEAVGSGPVDLADPHAREMLADQLQKLQNKLDESKALNAYYRKHKSFDGFPGLTAEAAAGLGLPADVIVCAGAGDNAAAAVGCGAVGGGRCNISLGTSGTVFITSDSFGVDSHNALHSFAHADGGYHLMGCILSAASCNKWWNEEILHTQDFAAEQAPITPDKLGANDVYFLPYLMGERSPHNDPAARGAFLGLRMDTPRAALTQAVLEGVAFAIRDCVEIARAQGVEIAASTLCGGGAKSPLWREILANVLGIPLTLPQTEQGPGYGGAMLAAVACGAYPSVQACADALVRAKSTTEPDPAIVEKYNARYALWHTLYPALKASYAAMEALQ